MMRESYMMFLAVCAANSHEELDYEWFEAIADNEDEANEMMGKTNAVRFMNQVRIKRAGH